MTTRFSKTTQSALEALEYELLAFGDRQGHVINVHAELERIAGEKSFLILHLPIWRAAMSERDMVVIDLASWIKAFYERGGFLAKLHGDDLKALDRRWEKGHRPARDAALARLFPKAAKPWPSRQDVEALIAELANRFEPLFADRGANRAHKSEAAVKGARAAMLLPHEVTKELEACQSLVADLRLLSSDSQFDAYGYKPEVSPGDWFVEDVVDHVLRGSLPAIVEADHAARSKGQFYWQRRAAYYRELHTDHDRRVAAGEKYFFNAPPRKD